MRNAAVARIVLARRAAESGVDYSPRRGARCPWCGGRCRIYRTMRWDGPVRVRYHRCDRKGCVVAAMKLSIKSIEEDHVKQETMEGNGHGK